MRIERNIVNQVEFAVARAFMAHCETYSPSRLNFTTREFT